MKKLWFPALTATLLTVGLSFGSAAHADGWRDGFKQGHGRHYEHRDHYRNNHRYYAPPRRAYYRPYYPAREVVYYGPAPVYYEPAPVYYGGRSGVSGSITVHF